MAERSSRLTVAYHGEDRPAFCVAWRGHAGGGGVAGAACQAECAFVVQLLGGQLGLGLHYGGDVSLWGVPVDGFHVPQLPEDELSVRNGDVKTTQHFPFTVPSL